MQEAAQQEQKMVQWHDNSTIKLQCDQVGERQHGCDTVESRRKITDNYGANIQHNFFSLD